MGKELDWAKRGKAKEHKLRREIIEKMLDGKLVSPKSLSKHFDEALGNVAYHITSLHEDGVIAFVAGKQRRGATEHFYRIKKEWIVTTEDAKVAPA